MIIGAFIYGNVVISITLCEHIILLSTQGKSRPLTWMHSGSLLKMFPTDGFDTT